MNSTMRRKRIQNFNSLTKPNFNVDKVISLNKWKEDNPEDDVYPKKYLQMKKIIRRLKEDIEKLQSENIEMKKSIKYTRIKELQI